jgi:anti-sigma factor RsiW
MKCDEVQTMQGPYLDSELDAKTTLEIERHLAACPACARLFAQEQKLEARITAGLKQGPRTAALWDQIESSVVAAAPLYPDLLTGCEDLTQRQGREPQRVAERAFSLGSSAFLCVSALRLFWLRLRFGWQRSRWAWTGLAAVWAVILVLHLAAREPEARLVAAQEVPSASEMRLALEQKYLLMAELALTSEPALADKPKPARPSPHSERRNETLNA